MLRGSAVNAYGDEIDGTTAVASKIVGSVIERSRKVFDPQSGRVATVRYLIGRFPSNSAIQDGDRIKDEKTGEVFVVSALNHPTNAVMKSDIVAELTKA